MKKKIYRGTIFCLLIISITGNCLLISNAWGALGLIITILCVISLPLWNEGVIFKTAEQLEKEIDAHIRSKEIYTQAHKLIIKQNERLSKQKSNSKSSRPR